MALQLTFDCTDPHAQARFWAAALDYDVDDHDEMIGGLIDAGHITADSDDITMVDGRRIWRHYASASPRDPADKNRALFQAVPEPKTAKNRLHLDLHAPDGERDAMVDRLLALGATKLWDGQLGPQTWVTLADPEGNELCVS
ncbi:MAG: VOC family protein [Acidimicrobiales bacterium]